MLIALAAMAIMATAAQDQDQPAQAHKFFSIPWFHKRADKQAAIDGQGDGQGAGQGDGRGQHHPLHRHRVDTKIYKSNHGRYGWRVVVRNDAFTGLFSCVVSSGEGQDRITYSGRTLGFLFDTYVDPNKTWFRADDNPPQRLSSVYPTLYARGQVVPPRDIKNLSKTTVLIPMESVEGASYITIRTEDKAKAREFRLIGFSEALASAEAHGCTEDSYVRDTAPRPHLF